MYGIASASTSHVSAATGANAATPIRSISATAASGSRRRPRKTFPPAWSQAAVNASRKAFSDTGQPYAGLQPLFVLDDLDDAGRGAQRGDRSAGGLVDKDARRPRQFGLVPRARSVEPAVAEDHAARVQRRPLEVRDRGCRIARRLPRDALHEKT